MSSNTFDSVIIGAGSIGLPLGYELARRGWKVAMIDRNPAPGSGQNKTAIGGIRATHSDPAKIQICRRSLPLVQALETEHGFDVEWFQGGYVFPVYDEDKEKALRKLLVVQKQHELEIDWVSPKRMQELVPGIDPDGLRGGTFSPGDGSASPLSVAHAYHALARRAGVDFRLGEEVRDFEQHNGHIDAVITDKGRYSGALIVDASGASARPMAAKLGLDVPVYPDSHEAGITEPVKRFFQPMVVDIRAEAQSANYYFYQNKLGQVVFCLTPLPKIDGIDTDCTSEFLPLVIRRMVQLYPRLRNLRVRRTWRGLYPMTPDGFPIVGYPKEIDNLLLMVGMCGQGFMLGPGLGEIIAETLVEGSDRHQVIFEQLSLARSFTGQEVLK